MTTMGVDDVPAWSNAAGGVLGSVGSFLSQNSGAIGRLFNSGSQLYGQQNAGEAVSKASTAGIGTANATMGNINALYKPQTTLGNGAMSTLGSTLGINGQPANYNNFLNMPGYKFAVDQGTQAIQRQAASMGSAYTPNTAQAVGQYVTGTAMQDYNTYVQQLLQSSQLGASANQNLTDANLRTAGNIEQLGQNAGMAQAGMYTGMGQSIGNLNGSGVGGGSGSSSSSGSSGVIGNIAKDVGNWLSGTSLGSFASGAPANAAVTDALGSVGSQTAGTSADVAASNEAALNGMGGAGGAAAGMLSLGNLGSGLAANAAVAGELGTVGAQTAGTSAAIAASNAAALGGGAGAGGAGAGAAGTAAGGTALGAAGALAGAALPLALAALVPYNSGFSNSEVQGMLGNIAAATKANGGPISAASGYGMNPDGTVNQSQSQTLNDLYTLLGDNSDEFTKAGGQSWVYQQLTNLGYGNLVNGMPGAITTAAPGGRGWIGGSSRGTVRK